jgi:serine/threonine protein kinase
MTERSGDPDPTRVFRADEAGETKGPGEELVGTVFVGRYRILKCLGKGAMGAVYEAEHVKIGRRDAIKVLQASIARDPEATQRFLRGARNASQIRHPNVGAIYDFGETPDGLQYLAMEFVEGETLTGLIRREGPLDLMRSLHIVRQIAAGLQAAHEQGIVHRDLKPDNVMVGRTRSGADFVKVVDFDIARGSKEGEGMDVTRAGFVVGTPEYMSPEQLTGDKLDGRSDLYALGLIFFRMVTGALPFKGATAQELMVQRLTRDPLSLGETAPGRSFPAGLQGFFDRALARSAAERFPDALAFTEALAEVLGTEAAPLPGGAGSMPSETGTRSGAGAGTSATVPGTRVRAWTPGGTGEEEGSRWPSWTRVAVGALVVLAAGGAGVGGLAYVTADREPATAMAPDSADVLLGVDEEDPGATDADGTRSEPPAGTAAERQAGTTTRPDPPPAERGTAPTETGTETPVREIALPSVPPRELLMQQYMRLDEVGRDRAGLLAIRDTTGLVWEHASMSRADSAFASHVMGVTLLALDPSAADSVRAVEWLERAVRLDPDSRGYRTAWEPHRGGGR